MTSNKLIISILVLFVFIASSCSKDDPTESIVKWKSDNDSYFANMKDSTGYIKDTVATSIGNLFYYYKITTPGDQSSTNPTYSSYVKVNYKGSLITGSIFDETYTGSNPENDSTAKPANFYANQLIPGWTINLTQMKTGEIRTIVLPHELCYGIYGMGPVIPPYSTLKFDIQLISFTN
ncbi:MAG TPA: FKBP-type peptidyl-prolyl cis-trans isomerase [Paludibacter sp.]